ncbi:MAG: MarR family transcriptional regulator [Streptococcaceae bacterium]|jgi:DNA-binding MarR family transcriptional regulator|nr:MarR family transcriptional regulator [Streptococcaceae bacterium]
MSTQTNELLNLFAKLLHSPRFLTALHIEMMTSKLRNPGNRKGAQGLLIELWKQDGLTNAEVAELLDIKPSSVTAQVNQLEETGLVERRTDENDGRVSRVFLTEQGRMAQTEHKEQYDGMSEEIFGQLNKEEQQQLKVLISKLVSAQTDDDWDWENSRGARHHRFGPAFNPHEMHRAMNGLRRAGRDLKREMRQNMRGKDKDEKWDDF